MRPYVKAKHTVNTRANKRVRQEFIQTDGLHVKNEELLRILREAKENNLDFKSIMAKDKQYKNFDMKYISQAARN